MVFSYGSVKGVVELISCMSFAGMQKDDSLRLSFFAAPFKRLHLSSSSRTWAKEGLRPHRRTSLATCWSAAWPRPRSTLWRCP